MALEIPFLKAVARAPTEQQPELTPRQSVARHTSAPSPGGRGVQLRPSHSSPKSGRDQSGLPRRYSQPPFDERSHSPSSPSNPVLGGAAATQARIAEMSSASRGQLPMPDSPSSSSTCPGNRVSPSAGLRSSSSGSSLRRPLLPPGRSGAGESPVSRPVRGTDLLVAPPAVGQPGRTGMPAAPSDSKSTPGATPSASVGTPGVSLAALTGRQGIREAIGAQVRSTGASRGVHEDG